MEACEAREAWCVGGLEFVTRERQAFMSKSSKMGAKTAALQLIQGLEANVASLPTLVVLGKTVSNAQAIATLQARVNVISAAQAARVAWTDALSQLDLQLASTDAFVDSLVTVIRGMYAGSPSSLADFGQTPRKVTVRTAAQKEVAAQKAAATRKARHTMGSKQKAAIKGTGPSTPSSAT